MKLYAVLRLAVSSVGLAWVFMACGPDKLPPSESDVLPDTGIDTAPPPDSGGPASNTVTIEPAEISFGENGLVDCGSQAPSKSITIKNDTNDSLKFEAKVTSSGDKKYYTVSPESGTLRGRETGGIQIIPVAIPADSAVTNDLYAGTVEIVTASAFEAGAAPLKSTIVRLHQTARGAIIVSTIGGKDLDFGGTKIGKTSSQQFSVTNNGNVAVNATFSLGSQIFGVSPAQNPIGPGLTVAPNVSFSPTSVQPYTDTLTMAISNTPRCGPLPGNTTLKGSGTNAIDVFPASLNYGLVNCATAAAFQTITIDNTGAATTFTPTLAKQSSSPFTLADNAGSAIVPGVAINLAAASSYVMRVIPKTIVQPASTAANAQGDTLTITTTSPADVPHNVQLNQTARGAFLRLNPLSIASSDAAGSHVTFHNFQILNDGNLPSNYAIAATPRAGAPGDTFKINLSTGQLFGGQSQPGVLEMKSPSNKFCGQYLGDIVLTPTAEVLCSDAQPKMPLSIETSFAPALVTTCQ